jgi:anti-sigma factor RsiW
VRRTISRKDVSWSAPDHVRIGVMQTLASEAARRTQPEWLRTPGRRPTVGTITGLIRQWLFLPSFAALAASLFLVFGPLQTHSSLEDEIVASHIRSTLANHLTDVQTSDQHTVKPWFNGKLDFAPPVADLAAQGFPLVGGRVDYVGGRVVAALIYRRHGHVVNLFIWPGATAPAKGATHDGYALESWNSGGLEFVAVSDTSADDIHRFRQAFASQTEKDRSVE